MSLSCLKSFSGCPLSASCSLTRPLTVWPCQGRCFRRFWIWNVQTPHLKILKICLYGHFVFSFVKKFPQVIKVPGPIKSNSTPWALPSLQPHFMSVSLSLSLSSPFSPLPSVPFPATPSHPLYSLRVWGRLNGHPGTSPTKLFFGTLMIHLSWKKGLLHPTTFPKIHNQLLHAILYHGYTVRFLCVLSHLAAICPTGLRPALP